MPDCFLTPEFNELNSYKTGRVVVLGGSGCRLIGGLTDNFLSSPFSAPYGGVVCDNPETGNITAFGNFLTDYLRENNYGCRITFPAPVLDDATVEVNGILRQYLLEKGFKVEWIDYNYHVVMEDQKVDPNVRRRYRKSLAAGYRFMTYPFSADNLKRVYDVVAMNHKRLGYKMTMSFQGFLETSKIVPIWLFGVEFAGALIAGAICYRTRNGVLQVICWGDDLDYRNTYGTMSFLAYSLINWVRDNVIDINVIDLGPASKEGVRSEGLITFKKSLGAIETEKFTISWMRN